MVSLFIINSKDTLCIWQSVFNHESICYRQLVPVHTQSVSTERFSVTLQNGR